MSNRTRTTAVAVAAAALAATPTIDLAHFNNRFEDAAGQQATQQQPNATQNAAQQATAGSTASLREEFNRLRSEGISVSDAAAAANRALTADEIAANNVRFARLGVIEAIVTDRQRFATLSIASDAPASAGDTIQRGNGNPPGGDQFRQANQEHDITVAEQMTPERYAMQRAAVNHFIRTGETRHNQFVLTTTGGGVNVPVPTTIAKPIVIKRIANPFRAALAARGFITISGSSANPITVPVFDDTANTADVIAENNTSENNKDPAVTNLTLGSKLYDSGTVWNSNTLLGSLDYDLMAFIDPMLDLRIDYAQLTAWTTSVVTTGTVGVTTASTTGVTYNELLNWQHSIPLRYRRTGVFILSDGLFRAIRGMVDTQGHPIYQESLRDDAPDKLLGWPIFLSEQLATPAANAVTGIAAAAETLFIRDVTPNRIARYVDVPTHPDQFGIRKFANGDFTYQAAGVRLLKQSA